MTDNKDSSTQAKKQNREGKTNQATKELEPKGFQIPEVDIDTEFDSEEPVRSDLSDEVAVKSAQLLELNGNEGSIIFYPKARDFAVGDVLYLRDKLQSVKELTIESETETGLIVQIISKGIAAYPQADSKALFRLLTTAHAREMKRSYNEPREVIDEFLIGEFIVRASLQNGKWKEPEGKVVTRNVDIFAIAPAFLLKNVIKSVEALNLDLGTIGNQEHPVKVYAGGFEKVNLITGMKGGGKSHITKGIIHLQRQLGMPSLVFDINGEYGSLPKANRIRPTRDFKFRLDLLPIPSIFKVFEKLSLFNTAATDNAVRANLPGLIEARNLAGHFADLQFLLDQAQEVVGEQREMLGAYRRGINNLMSYNLFSTSSEAQEEEKALRENRSPSTKVVSLRTVLYRMAHGIENEEHKQGNKQQDLEDLKNHSGVIVFDIGGLPPIIQKVVVTLVIDQMKEICRLQYEFFQANKVEIPIYPSVFFEEAHMYMDERYIDELIPLIRHLGMNLFFVTNTPGALPDSVFRLVDNVIMTRMVNQQDINKVISCGLADKKTIEGFARDLPKYHNLFLSTTNGATNNFPLVFLVRDFTAPVEKGGEGLPKSGITRSMWEVISQRVGIARGDVHK
ncbi:DUF87 domain-containing protein [Microcoleus sp. C2C3]|uniref:helicase HerA domain-containing protein n=1 Tax=unclassified Microcoleus TaxID=2642155 RepID=UPI002FD1D7C5